MCTTRPSNSAMHTPLMCPDLSWDWMQVALPTLVSPTTMGQRLVRAKIKIRDAGIQFEVPQERELPQRLDAVLEAMYAAFGIGWDDMAGVDQRGQGSGRGGDLARTCSDSCPGKPRFGGLLALMLHCEAHRARRGPDGRFVPLSEQNTQQWSLPLIEEAERHLAEAARHGCHHDTWVRYTRSGGAPGLRVGCHHAVLRTS